MPARPAHPPAPGGLVQPNFLPVMDAIGIVSFPISKRELVEQVGDETVLLGGRNVELHELIKDIPDDYFASDAEFLDALTMSYTLSPDEPEPPGVGTMPGTSTMAPDAPGEAEGAKPPPPDF